VNGLITGVKTPSGATVGEKSYDAGKKKERRK
jgi:hypothetical protein